MATVTIARAGSSNCGPVMSLPLRPANPWESGHWFARWPKRRGPVPIPGY